VIISAILRFSSRDRGSTVDLRKGIVMRHLKTALLASAMVAIGAAHSADATVYIAYQYGAGPLTVVATDPTELMATPRCQPRSRCRRWWRTMPHWLNVNEVNTPTA